MFEEVYSELFTFIRDRNKSKNEKAILHIPKDWCDFQYEELTDIFNLDYSDKS